MLWFVKVVAMADLWVIRRWEPFRLAPRCILPSESCYVGGIAGTDKHDPGSNESTLRTQGMNWHLWQLFEIELARKQNRLKFERGLTRNLTFICLAWGKKSSALFFKNNKITYIQCFAAVPDPLHDCQRWSRSQREMYRTPIFACIFIYTSRCTLILWTRATYDISYWGVRNFCDRSRLLILIGSHLHILDSSSSAHVVF